MVAYMNKESIDQTVKIKEAVFWSRSRQEIWHKGSTSGDYLKVKDLILDCDLDAILLVVEMVGKSACHNGTKSCFIEPTNHQARSLLI
jgi:phosphoribosyl-AMP cyclohydrolase